MKVTNLFTKSDLVFIETIFDYFISNLSEEYKKGNNLETYKQILSIRDKCLGRLDKGLPNDR